MLNLNREAFSAQCRWIADSIYLANRFKAIEARHYRAYPSSWINQWMRLMLNLTAHWIQMSAPAQIGYFSSVLELPCSTILKIWPSSISTVATISTWNQCDYPAKRISVVILSPHGDRNFQQNAMASSSSHLIACQFSSISITMTNHFLSLQWSTHRGQSLHI